eukprot:5006867-Amphidinium_carterae.1
MVCWMSLRMTCEEVCLEACNKNQRKKSSQDKQNHKGVKEKCVSFCGPYLGPTILIWNGSLLEQF